MWKERGEHRPAAWMGRGLRKAALHTGRSRQALITTIYFDSSDYFLNLKFVITYKYNFLRLPSRFCGINIITDKFGHCFLKTSDMSHSNPIYTLCFLLFFCFVELTFFVWIYSKTRIFVLNLFHFAIVSFFLDLLVIFKQKNVVY